MPLLVAWAPPPWACCQSRASREDGEDSSDVTRILEEGKGLADQTPDPGLGPRASRSSLRDPQKSGPRLSGNLSVQFSSGEVEPPPVGDALGALERPEKPYGQSFRAQSTDLSELLAGTFPDPPTPSAPSGAGAEVSPRSADSGQASPRGIGKAEVSPRNAEDKSAKGKRLMRLASAAEVGGVSESQMINIYNPGKLLGSYSVGHTIGSGSFGTVRKGSVMATGAIRAIKSIKKEGSVQWKKCMEKELQIFKMVDHPNIVKLYEVFEDKERLHLVLEFCAGGELFPRVPYDGVTEAEAAMVMIQLLRGTLYLHKKYICHRDLKAQNLLVTTKGNAYEHTIRITDFGLSCIFREGEFMTSKVGTFTHMSPQVLNKKYTKACDVWACGVIMFHLMSGVLPFEGISDDEIASKVKKGRVSYGRGWADRSTDSVELCQMLMYQQEESRYTATKALENRWLNLHFAQAQGSPKLDYAILENLRGFRKLNKLKKAILSVVASMLTEPQIRPARLAFMSLDKDGDGAVSVSELRSKLLQMKEERLAKQERQRKREKAKAEANAAEEEAISSPRSPRGSSPRDGEEANSASWALRQLAKTAGLAGIGSTPVSDFNSPAGGSPSSTPRSPQGSPRSASPRSPRAGRKTTRKGKDEEEDEEGSTRKRGQNTVFGQQLDEVLKDMFAEEGARVGLQRTPSGHLKKSCTLDSLGASDNGMPDFPYTEFLAATFDRERFINDNICLAAFRVMDKDQDGKLTLSDIGSGALLGKISEEDYNQILEEVDVNGDGQIDLEEFTALVMGCTGEGWTKCFNRGSTVSAVA